MKVKDHIAELKKRVLLIGIVATIVFIIGFIFSKDILIGLINYLGITVYNFTPLENINSQMFISFIIATLVCIPLIFYQIYGFCKPILKDTKIKKYLTFSIILSIVGFILGITLFSKLIIGTLMESSFFTSMVSLDSVIKLSMTIGYSIALCFNMIIIIPFLTKVEVINKETIVKSLPKILIATLLFAGFITPGADVFSQFVVAIPMLGSIGIGTLLSKNIKGGKTCLD